MGDPDPLSSPVAKSVAFILDPKSAHEDAPRVGVASNESDSRYRVDGELGVGGMGRVLEAHDARFGRSVALKELLPDARSPESEERFLVEAIVTANLEHPGVPAVYDFAKRADGTPYYVMRLVRGKTLADAIKEAPTLALRLRLLPAVISVAQTLAHAHEQGVIHRDVKPQNVILGRHGETVLLDWGIARTRGIADRLAPGSASGDERMTRYGAIFGTPAFMAPEQAAGRATDVDERTDVFALGSLLYCVLTGRAPYAGASLADVLEKVRSASPPPIDEAAPDAPEALRAIVKKAMAREPAERHRSAVEVAAALEGFTSQAIASAPSRIEIAVGATTALLIAISVATIAGSFAASGAADLGPAAIFYSLVALLGITLIAVEGRTRGRHRLAPIILGVVGFTLVGSFVQTLSGIDRSLAAVTATFADDERMFRLMLAEGTRESLRNLSFGAQLAAIQLAALAFVWRRNTRQR